MMSKTCVDKCIVCRPYQKRHTYHQQRQCDEGTREAYGMSPEMR